MGKLTSPIKTLRWRTWEAGALLLVLCILPPCSRGQAAVETAGTDSASAGATAAAAKSLPAPLPRPGANNNLPYIPAREGPPPEETNRRALEQRAGKDAAKLLLQSVPSDAMIYIDGMSVGRTPLLVIVSPQKYKVEMRGRREEFGQRLIDLSPNETQQLTLALALRYPESVMAQTGRAAAASGVAARGVQVFPASSLPHPGEESKPASLPARQAPSPEETNRRALETRAGKDPAKLVLRSVPSGAMAYVDGTAVGRTPLQLVVPPGKYKVEMRGMREEFGERLVGLLPNETQELTLELALRYPSRISAR